MNIICIMLIGLCCLGLIYVIFSIVRRHTCKHTLKNFKKDIDSKWYYCEKYGERNWRGEDYHD